MLAELFGDLNCPKCREAVMLDGRSITKRSIMLDAVNSIISIEQMFIEAIYWKMHRSEESPINPDPDGVLAEAWQAQADQIIRMIELARPLMQKHEAKYGWPELLKAESADEE